MAKNTSKPSRAAKGDGGGRYGEAHAGKAADTHPGDPDNRPITQADIDAGTLKMVKRRGRPVGTGAGKVRITMRLDPDVLKALREDGPGWQTRANSHLRTALNLDP